MPLTDNDRCVCGHLHYNWQACGENNCDCYKFRSAKLAMYSHRVRWRKFDGSTHYIDSYEAFSPWQARFSALKAAINCGYTRRRWWQYWRYWEHLEANERAFLMWNIKWLVTALMGTAAFFRLGYQLGRVAGLQEAIDVIKDL